LANIDDLVKSLKAVIPAKQSTSGGQNIRQLAIVEIGKFDDLVKSLLGRHPGESRGPEHLEMTGFRLSPE